MASLSIIIPAFNEESRLGGTLSKIEAAWREGRMPGLELLEVIIADDGSTDQTVNVAESWKAKLPVVTVRLPENRGKGAACRAGVAAAKGSLVLLYDADGAAPIEEANALFERFKATNADIAIGSRLGEDGATVKRTWYRRVIGRTYWLFCHSLIPGIRDAACGCKLFKADVAKRIFSLQRIDRFAFDIEVLAIGIKLKYKIEEVPLNWTEMPESKVRLVQDGLQMLWCIVLMHFRSDIRG